MTTTIIPPVSGRRPPSGAHTLHRCSGTNGSAGMEAGHPATTSWADALRTSTTPALQVFADGEWHPVKAFASDWCEPWETCEIKDLLGEEIGA